MRVCDLAAGTIIGAATARLRGDGDALDGHALLAQLKVAAALGIADGRYAVTDDDWSLAEIVMHKSAAVRSSVQQTLSAKTKEANFARGEAEAARTIQVAEKVADAAVKRVCGSVMR